MDKEFTVESFSAFLKDLNNEDDDSTFNLSKTGDSGAIRLQLNTNPPAQKTLDECLLIGLISLSIQHQHIAFVVAALNLLLQLGAKWDSSTLFDLQETPYQHQLGPRYEGQLMSDGGA